jgi:hypothetical protein
LISAENKLSQKPLLQRFLRNAESQNISTIGYESACSEKSSVKTSDAKKFAKRKHTAERNWFSRKVGGSVSEISIRLASDGQDHHRA